MKEKLCKKTGKPFRQDVIIGGVNLGKQMDFEQLNLCISCDNEPCIRKILGKGKLVRRRGI